MRRSSSNQQQNDFGQNCIQQNDEGYDIDEILRKQRSDNRVKKKNSEKLKRKQLIQSITEMKNENHKLGQKVYEMDENFEELMNIQQDDHHLTAVLSIAEDVFNQSPSQPTEDYPQSSSSCNGSISYASPLSMQSPITPPNFFNDNNNKETQNENDDDDEKIQNISLSEYQPKESVDLSEINRKQKKEQEGEWASIPQTDSKPFFSESDFYHDNMRKNEEMQFLDMIISQIKRNEQEMAEQELVEEEDGVGAHRTSLPSIWA
mmetsp:Transcript_14129/g.16828  ORF Transcript_14129/g.16828 Transcript_14129/m.16828 type:complete len:262 (-) Transcript_14129:207-992(-)